MGAPETDIEKKTAFYPIPSPDDILEFTGVLFCTGAAGGSAFHFLKGVRTSPKGARLLGAAQAVRSNAPRVGGRWGAWAGLQSTFECSLYHLRQKQDPWNTIVSGAAASGLLRARRGIRAASRSAVAGGVFFAVFEGVMIAWSRYKGVDDRGPDFGRRKEQEEEKESDGGGLIFDYLFPPTHEFK